MKLFNKKNLLFAAFPLFAIFFLEIFFFRNMFFNGNLFGDDGDGRLTMLLTEHWWRFFSGKEKFLDALMFYPVHGVMAFSDLFLGYGIIHSVFRLFGFDVYHSYKYTLFFLHVLGSFSFFYLLKRKLRINIFWSFFALIAFSYSTVFADIGFVHSQLSAVNLLPVCSIFFTNIILKWKERLQRNLNITLFILTYAIILYSSWYIAFFIALFCFVLVVVYFFLLCKNKINLLKAIRKIFLDDLKADVFAFLFLILVLFVPFVIIYLPSLKNSGGYAYSPFYMPEVADLINVTANNFFFGQAVSFLRLSGGEVATGFSLFVLFFFFITFHFFKRRNITVTYKNLFFQSIFFSVIICALLCIRFNANGASFWMLVYNFFPGGKSIRAVGRFMFFLSFPLSLTIALFGSYFDCKFTHWKKYILGVVILSCLFLVQVSKNGCSTNWSRGKSLKKMSEVSMPPKDMKAFFILNTENDNHPLPYKHLDAYEIANRFGIPTINGYSGVNPRNWGDIWNIGNPRYVFAVRLWCMENNLSDGIYAYNPLENKWISLDDAADSEIIEMLCFDKKNGATANKYCASGFSDSENYFTWNDGHEAKMIFNFGENAAYRLSFSYNVFLGPQLVEVFASSKKISSFIANGSQEKTFVFPKECMKDGALEVVFKFPDAKTPKSVGVNDDQRLLALAFKSLIVEKLIDK